MSKSSTKTPDSHKRVEYLEVTGFNELRHYKDRAMIWIKIHLTILDDYSYLKLPDAAKGQLINLMLLAARMGNRLPNDPEFLARQIGANSEFQLDVLIEAGFIIPAKRKKTQGNSASKTGAKPEQKRTHKQEQKQEAETATTTTPTHEAEQASVPPTPVAGGDVVVGNFGQTGSAETANGKASRHTRAEVAEYLEDCNRKGQQPPIRSVDSLATKLLKTGEADETIQDFLDRRARASLDTSECPRCGGLGMWYPNGFQRGVAKCKHEPLMNSTVAVEQRVSA